MNNNTSRQPLSPLLFAYGNQCQTIPYRKEFNAVTGKHSSSILLQQFLFRGGQQNPFYKFQAPCNHQKYRKGDSWQEELGFSRKEFETALSRIATKITTGMSKSEVMSRQTPESMIVYWTDANRVTWWELNLPLIEKLLSKCLIREAELMSESDISSNVRKSHYQLMPESDITYSLSEKTSENMHREDEQPTHTPAESSDQGKGIQVNETETQKVKTPSPVKNSHTEVEPISVSEQSSLENNPAGARENFAPSVAKNAPESVEATESVQSIVEPVKAAYSSNSAGMMNLSKFMQVYNACRGNWKPLSVAPPPVVVEGISSYRNRFDGTDEEFFQFFPLLVKAAQSSGGWLAGSRNPSQIFSVERLPLTDVWSDALQAKQPASATAKPIEVSPDFSLKSFID